MNHDFSIVFDTENELWQRVLDIYVKNENYEKKVVNNRNLHHKFPKSFSKALGEEVDNDEDNLISLSLAEHFLVHYYYYKLAKKGFRKSMSLAFRLMARNGIKHITPATAEAIAKDYEESCKISPMKGKHHTKESKIKMSEAHKDRKLSKESKIKMSEAHKGRISPRKGVTLSEETKRKISESNKGKHKGITMSEESRRKMSEAKKGKHLTEETKIKMTEARKLYWKRRKQHKLIK